jgi:hypothetical protein
VGRLSQFAWKRGNVAPSSAIPDVQTAGLRHQRPGQQASTVHAAQGSIVGKVKMA